MRGWEQAPGEGREEEDVGRRGELKWGMGGGEVEGGGEVVEEEKEEGEGVSTAPELHMEKYMYMYSMLFQSMSIFNEYLITCNACTYTTIS